MGARAGEASIRALLIVQRDAFGETYSVDADAIELFRRIGTDSVLARLADGTPVGGAGRLAGARRCERDRGRRRRRALAWPRDRRRADRGRFGARRPGGPKLLFITPENERAGRVYERAGFVLEPACTRVKLKLPA